MMDNVTELERLLETAQQERYRTLEQRLLKELGDAHYDAREFHRAQRAYAQAAKIAREEDDPLAESVALGSIGDALSASGEIQKAIQQYEQALNIVEELRPHELSKEVKAQMLGKLGMALQNAGNTARAIEYYERALAIEEEADDYEAIPVILRSLGSAATGEGLIEDALSYYERALEVLRKTGDHRTAAAVLNDMAATYMAINQFQRAIGAYKQALDIAQEPLINSTTLVGLGALYRRMGDYDNAVRYYKEARQVGELADDAVLVAYTLTNLARLVAESGELQRAVDLYEQALAASRKTGDRRLMYYLSKTLHNHYKSLGDPERAAFYERETEGLSSEPEGFDPSPIGDKQVRTGTETTSRTTHLEDAVAVVTGASRGLGRAIAEELGRGGAKVVINYARSKEPAEELVEHLAQNGSEAVAIQADVSDAEQAERLINETVEKFGRIDVLVNNAGINRDKTLKKLSVEDWDTVVQTDLNSVFYTVHAALPHMMEQGGGTIINMSSFVGEAGNVGQANYAAAKAGLLGFTKTAAQELARYGITVNAICPGFIETDMVANIPEEAREKLLKTVPLGRFGKPEEIARAVRYLVEDGDYITGQALDINGGVYMRT